MQDANIKKVYVELFNLLNDNKNKKVSTVLAQATALMSKATTAVESTLRYDDEGNLTHIYCYYHKEWEAIADVEYGKKASTKSGYNTMCKQGVSSWTKQQRAKKQAEAMLLDEVVKGTIEVDQVETIKAEILEASKLITPRS